MDIMVGRTPHGSLGNTKGKENVIPFGNPRQAHPLQQPAGEEDSEEAIMNTLSRRQFLRTSGTVVAATMVPSVVLSGRARAADKELTPRKLPFPPNDEFGSYEPTITPDGNTIYFARFAGSGDKRVLGTTTSSRTGSARPVSGPGRARTGRRPSDCPIPSTAIPSIKSRGSPRTVRRSTS
jgi:hypothetical protein